MVAAGSGFPKASSKDPDDVIGVRRGDGVILDEWQDLGLGASFQAVEGVRHSERGGPRGGGRKSGCVAAQLQA